MTVLMAVTKEKSKLRMESWLLMVKLLLYIHSKFIHNHTIPYCIFQTFEAAGMGECLERPSP